MNVTGRKKIHEFSHTHADIRSHLSAWLYEIEDADWQSPMDIKERFPSASLIGNNRVIFNIKGNHYRIDTKISFKNKSVFIKRIGTHAEYNKWTF